MIVKVRRMGRFYLDMEVEIPDDTPEDDIEDVALCQSDIDGWGWDEADHETENITAEASE